MKMLSNNNNNNNDNNKNNIHMYIPPYIVDISCL